MPITVVAAMIGGLGCGVTTPAGAGGERIREERAALVEGTVDSAPAAYPAVVAIYRPGLAHRATGVALSDRVIATAGHLVSEITRGCEGYSYDQAQPAAGLVVKLADSNGQTAHSDPALTYNVDAVVGRRRVSPVNAYDCSSCQADPTTCFGCTASNSYHNFWHAFDIALLHLDKPLQGVTPMNFVARLGPANPKKHQWPIHPEQWFGATANDPDDAVDPNHVVALVVGTGDDAYTNGTAGVRKYGPTTLLRMNDSWSQMLDPAGCDAPVFREISCDGCMLHSTSNPTASLPAGGGAYQIHGDSGGPVIVNDTRHGGTRIPELPVDPSGEGVPFVVGLFSYFSPLQDHPSDQASALTWDAPLGNGDSTDNGSFILAHLDDWDLDGARESNGADNCPITPNDPHQNANAEVESQYVFPAVGDACDPIPSASLSLGPMAFFEQDTFVNNYLVERYLIRVEDTIHVKPLGSHFFSSGAMNHIPLPEVSVGSVQTYYRFCQSDGSNGVFCDRKAAYDNQHLFNEPQQLDPTRPWMRATMQGLPDVHTEALSYPLPQGQVPRTWLYQQDVTAWTAAHKVVIPSPPPAACAPQYGCVTGLDGKFWVRSDTTKGTSGNLVTRPATKLTPPEAPPNTGYRWLQQFDPPSADDVQLSNTYVNMMPDSVVHWTVSLPLIPYPYFKFMWSPPDPPPEWLSPLERATYLMPLPEGHVGALMSDGMAFVADALVAPGLLAALGDPAIRWVDAVEPRLTVGSSRFRPGAQAIGLASGGTAVSHVVGRNGNLYGTATEVTAISCAAPPSDMLGWWPLDGSGAGAAGTSAPHDGVAHGGVAFEDDGVAGPAARLPWVEDWGPNGAYVRVENTDHAFDLVNDFTVEGWINPRATVHTYGQAIVSRGMANGWSVGLAPDGTLQAAKHGIGTLAAPVRVAPGRWQHVAVAFTSTGTRFYLDGRLVHSDAGWNGTLDIPYSSAYPAEPLVIGAQSYLSTVPMLTRYFDGMLDEVSVYNRVLAPEEILAIARAGASGKCKATSGGSTTGGGSTSGSGSSAGPAPRDAYVALFSRAENAVFVLGGSDPASGARLHDIWMQQVSPGGPWVAVQPVDYAAENILDATWSFYDHRLWVLDERSASTGTTLRLARIDPYSGARWVVGQWPRRSIGTDRWLVVDRDGQVLLVSSNPSKQEHTVMGFHATAFEDAAPIGASLTIRQGHLAFRPIADADGYTFFVAGSGGLQVDRAATLASVAAGLGADENELQ